MNQIICVRVGDLVVVPFQTFGAVGVAGALMADWTGYESTSDLDVQALGPTLGNWGGAFPKWSVPHC